MVPVSPTAYTWVTALPWMPYRGCDGGTSSGCHLPLTRFNRVPPAPAAHMVLVFGPQTVVRTGDVVSVVQEVPVPRTIVPSHPALSNRPALSPQTARRFSPVFGS